MLDSIFVESKPIVPFIFFKIPFIYTYVIHKSTPLIFTFYFVFEYKHFTHILSMCFPLFYVYNSIIFFYEWHHIKTNSSFEVVFPFLLSIFIKIFFWIIKSYQNFEHIFFLVSLNFFLIYTIISKQICAQIFSLLPS